MPSYQEILDYLYNQLPMFQRIGKPAYKHDLSKTLQLDKYFNHPHKNYKTIHIAGTNGKGSVAHSLASVLQENGFKTGLYTSPHYLDFRERIKINGQKIDKQYVVDFVVKHKHFFQKIKPSFFEITVAMAFEYFKDMNVDIAVIEVGMGGRLDSTNIITPILSIITNISYDHTQFLGNTLEQIASEKAGIIKNNIPVILGDTKPAVKNVIFQKAQQVDAQVFLANYVFSVNDFFSTSDNKVSFNVLKNGSLYLKNLKFGLTGQYQKQNIPVIIQAYELLKNQLNITEKSLRRGLEFVRENTGILGRWDIIGNNPKIILDSAHNEDGLTNVINQIRFMNFEKLHFIIGTVNDKDLDRILKILPKKAKYYFTKADIPRSLEPEKLKALAKKYQLEGEIYENVGLAISSAKNNAQPNDLILISGSTFVVADAYKSLKIS